MTTPKRKSVQDLDVRSLARGYTAVAIQSLSGVAQNGESEAARVAASIALLDRGWGKPNQPHDARLEGELRITIRKILNDE
jgi:hypothetical protein